MKGFKKGQETGEHEKDREGVAEGVDVGDGFGLERVNEEEERSEK